MRFDPLVGAGHQLNPLAAAVGRPMAPPPRIPAPRFTRFDPAVGAGDLLDPVAAAVAASLAGAELTAIEDVVFKAYDYTPEWKRVERAEEAQQPTRPTSISRSWGQCKAEAQVFPQCPRLCRAHRPVHGH